MGSPLPPKESAFVGFDQLCHLLAAWVLEKTLHSSKPQFVRVTLWYVLNEMMYVKYFTGSKCSIKGSYHHLYGNEIDPVPEPPLTHRLERLWETLPAVYVT